MSKNLMKYPLIAAAAVTTLFADEQEVMINPYAGPTIKDWSEFFVTGEFISFRARQDGLEYAMSGRRTDLSKELREGTVKTLDFDFQPGFRIGAGLNFRHDGWDIYFNYTWLNPRQHYASTHQKVETQGLESVWFSPVQSTSNPVVFPLLKAHVAWRLHFQTLDAELGRNYFVSPKLTLRPHVGFKAGWVDQDYDLKYIIDSSVTGFSSFSLSTLDFDQRCSAFGMRIGNKSAWEFADRWSIFGDIAASILWSDLMTKRKDKTNGLVSYHAKQNFHTLLPVLELAIGLRYTHDFRNGHWRVILQGGWEEQIWFAMNRLINYPDHHDENLTLQGGTARISFAF